MAAEGLPSPAEFAALRAGAKRGGGGGPPEEAAVRASVFRLMRAWASNETESLKVAEAELAMLAGAVLFTGEADIVFRRRWPPTEATVARFATLQRVLYGPVRAAGYAVERLDHATCGPVLIDERVRAPG